MVTPGVATAGDHRGTRIDFELVGVDVGKRDATSVVVADRKGAGIDGQSTGERVISDTSRVIASITQQIPGAGAVLDHRACSSGDFSGIGGGGVVATHGEGVGCQRNRAPDPAIEIGQRADGFGLV